MSNIMPFLSMKITYPLEETHRNNRFNDCFFPRKYRKIEIL